MLDPALELLLPEVARGCRAAECLARRQRRLSILESCLVGSQLILIRGQLLLRRDQAGLVLGLLGWGPARLGIGQSGLRGQQRRSGRLQVRLSLRRVDGGQHLPGCDVISHGDIDGGESAARIEVLVRRRRCREVSRSGHARLDSAPLHRHGPGVRRRCRRRRAVDGVEGKKRNQGHSEDQSAIAHQLAARAAPFTFWHWVLVPFTLSIRQTSSWASSLLTPWSTWSTSAWDAVMHRRRLRPGRRRWKYRKWTEANSMKGCPLSGGSHRGVSSNCGRRRTQCCLLRPYRSRPRIHLSAGGSRRPWRRPGTWGCWRSPGNHRSRRHPKAGGPPPSPNPPAPGRPPMGKVRKGHAVLRQTVPVGRERRR